MSLAEVLAELMGFLPLEGAEISAHSLGRNRERGFGLFPRGRGFKKTGAVGGFMGFEVLRLTALLRWGRDGGVAEVKAREIYDLLADCKLQGGFVMAVHDGPVWLGMDGRGVFEYVVDFDVYYDLGFCEIAGQARNDGGVAMTEGGFAMTGKDP